MLLVPYLPRSFGLAKEHLVAVLGGGSLLTTFAQEEGFFGVVDEVEEQVVGGEQVVRDGGTLVDVGEGAEGRAVDDDLICAEQVCIEVVIGDYSFATVA